jgi:predicted ferric reductase
LPARLPLVARALGAEVAVRLHRHLADVLVAAIAAHVALLVVADRSNLALFDPLGAPWRAKAAVASCAALAGLIASSVLRRRLRLSYARWRGLHVALGVGALAFGVVHAVGVDRYLTVGPAGVVAAALAAIGVLAVVELRLWRPRRLAARPYVVDRVVPERGGAISMLRTAADAGDRRPFVLVYGGRRWEEVTFREELERLGRRLDLEVVHVLTDPPKHWTGERGFIDGALLARRLPRDMRGADVFVCGPPPMLPAELAGLHRLGVAPEHVHAEQFVTV